MLLNVEMLKPSIQDSILKKIYINHRKPSSSLIVLASPSKEDTESILVSGLRADWVTEDKGFLLLCPKICSLAFKAILPKVQLYSSDSPSCGKTTSLIADNVIANNLPYSCLPVTGEFDQAVALLSTIERDRKIGCCANGVVLHFNIANSLDVDRLNNFFLSYIVMGCIMDSSGNCCVKNNTDIIVMEWPSEGEISKRAASSCIINRTITTKYLQMKLNLYKYVFTAVSGGTQDCVLFNVATVVDTDFELGLKMAIAYYSVGNGIFIMPYYSTIKNIVVPNELELLQFFYSKLIVPHTPPPTNSLFGV
jgi:hypothetical protein